jgi:hypothetical protein
VKEKNLFFFRSSATDFGDVFISGAEHVPAAST